MDKIIGLMKDIIKSLIVGFTVSFVLVILSGIGSFLFSHGNIITILDTIKNTLFFIGAMGLFVCAGFIAKRESRRPLKNKNAWKEQFKVIHFPSVIGIIDITILFAGVLFDRVIFYL